jgi:hypothetical protein
MDNAKHRLRASGYYADYQGKEYFADEFWDRIWLYTDQDPLPAGFTPSRLHWVNGEKLVDLDDIDGLRRFQTTCLWRGHLFSVGIIIGASANVNYLGRDFDAASKLPGMLRPDKFEVTGWVPVSELADLREEMSEAPKLSKDVVWRDPGER